MSGVAGAFPTYRYQCAPEGLATRRQLARLGLTPGRSPIVGDIIWRKGRRIAYLYEIRTAQAKTEPTPRQLAALSRAMRVRRTCTGCHVDAGYCLPIRWGRRCIDCHDTATTGAQPQDTYGAVAA